MGSEMCIRDRDNGVLPGGLGSREFDDEGIPTRVNTVIERGILKTFLYDTYTAYKEGKESTGNALRSYWSAPTPAPNNLILKVGDCSFDELISDVKEGIYIVTTIGEWLSNPVSGQLNATVTHGYLIKNGELTQPIGGFSISSNFYELIRSKVELLGKDLENYGSSYSPPVKVSEIIVASD